MVKQAKYLIGIDFGTTNSTVAYTLLEEGNDSEIKQFSIPQFMSSGELGEDLLLPSFIYFPLEEELKKGLANLPWDADRNYCIGHFAKERGSELPGRLVSSSKSWLCYDGIDRRAKLLPSGDDLQAQLSPLEACSVILQHLREAWDHSMDAPMKDQQVFITVPASFDPGARQLVEEAAHLAGYPQVILLEEPQAAFYAWLGRHKDDWRKLLQVGNVILVVDIGGGTTDFTTISVGEENGDLVLHRQAVGSHLLLGGDNIDLALAYMAKDRLEEKGAVIDAWQLQGLVHACRRGKEKLFNDPKAEHIDVAVLGRGSKLIGGSLKAKLTRAEVMKTLVDGFLPVVDASEQSNVSRRLGLRQIGLPYAEDARVTCQLAKFLSMTGENQTGQTDRFIVPSAVLFNGGTLKGELLRSRLIEQLMAWSQALNQEPVKELTGADYDLAVSRGAVFYGLARSGKAIRIKAGISRSYFIGVEDAAPAVPGRAPPLKAICVAPFGMEEGSEVILEDQEFALALGELATFRFFSRTTQHLSDGSEPTVGHVVKNWQQELSELHPIEALLDKQDGDGKMARVHLKAHVTALGVLELWCQSPEGRKWRLEYDIRKEEVPVGLLFTH